MGAAGEGGGGRGDGDRPPVYLVFSQHPPTADLGGWDAAARRFFDARLEPVEGGAATLRIAVQPLRAAAGIVALHGRERVDRDLELADEAERRAGGGGLAQLARRCESVWVVERAGEADPVALRLAAILAASLLGPIVDPAALEIFGVKTARGKLSVLQARSPAGGRTS